MTIVSLATDRSPSAGFVADEEGVPRSAASRELAWEELGRRAAAAHFLQQHRCAQHIVGNLHPNSYFAY